MDYKAVEQAARGADGGIANFMADIAETVRWSNGLVIEIGPGKGTGSTLAIQEGLAEHATPLHVSVELDDYMEWKPSVPWWEMVLGNSTSDETADRVAKLVARRAMELYDNPLKFQTAGVIFIDTFHDYPHMQRELQVWKSFAGRDTTWLMHDTHMYGAYNHMTDAIVEFARDNPQWVFEDWRQEPHGLGRMRWR